MTTPFTESVVEDLLGVGLCLSDMCRRRTTMVTNPHEQGQFLFKAFLGVASGNVS
jgi:hypothetical protein